MKQIRDFKIQLLRSCDEAFPGHNAWITAGLGIVCHFNMTHVFKKNANKVCQLSFRTQNKYLKPHRRTTCPLQGCVCLLQCTRRGESRAHHNKAPAHATTALPTVPGWEGLCQTAAISLWPGSFSSFPNLKMLDIFCDTSPEPILTRLIYCWLNWRQTSQFTQCVNTY